MNCRSTEIKRICGTSCAFEIWILILIFKILMNIDNINKNLTTAIITPDKEIVENANKLSPAYLVFDNYELILKWNRSLRFALAVCTLKDKFSNEL